jgi:putative ABC transport system permease protein
MIIQPRWRKVIMDLWGNKVRTALVVLSIAIGVFAIGMILGTDVMLRQDLTRGYLETTPADAILAVSPFDEELVAIARSVSGVSEAEGRRRLSLRAEIAPGQWKTIDIRAIPDFEDMRISKVWPEEGEWPPVANTLMIERASLPLINSQLGDVLTIQLSDGRTREMPIQGSVHDVSRPPAQFTGNPAAYITMPTLEWLGTDRTYSELHLLVEGAAGQSEIEAIVEEVKHKAERAGYTVFRTRVPTSGEHPVQEILDPILLILGALGALSLFASSFLVINIMNGLLSQQTQQIGIMKMVGARRGQIVYMYLVAIIILGLIALLIAIPAGGMAAYLFTRFIAGLLNFDLAGFRIPLRAMTVMVAIGLLVPLLAGLVPVLNGSRITVREALSSFGLGKGSFGSNGVDRLLSWATGIMNLSRPIQISLRNSIRRKARLLLTLITLTLGGSIFIGILSVHSSLLRTLDEALGYFAYDIDVNFDRTYRLNELQRIAMEVPGITAVEGWIGTSATPEWPDGREGDGFPLLGTNADTQFINPKILAGRWLLPDDTNAIVVNSDVFKDDPEVGIGDIISLNIDGRQRSWEVVGQVQGVLTGPMAYANRPFLERELRRFEQTDSLQVMIGDTYSTTQLEKALELRSHFEDNAIRVATVGTIGEVRERIEYQFNLLIVFLAVMAVLIAAVGGLGLMGTMSINVLERTREIGVLRAVGASDGAVLRIVLVEGIFIGLISWLLAAIFGYPIGRVLATMVGNSLLDNPLSYLYAYFGAIIWLVAILLIAAFASIFPALRAARLSVRQTLAYE